MCFPEKGKNGPTKHQKLTNKQKSVKKGLLLLELLDSEFFYTPKYNIDSGYMVRLYCCKHLKLNHRM